MEPQQIESMVLENGLTLEILDASRKVAVDCWQVKLVARMEIEVSDQWFGNIIRPPADMNQMRAKLGATRRFEYQTERSFVDQKEKQGIFTNLLSGLMANKHYYSHPDFAARFLTKEYAARRNYPDHP